MQTQVFSLSCDIDFHKMGIAGLALLKFRAKLEVDPFGALANWNPDDSGPCTWSGIECLDGNVVVL